MSHQANKIFIVIPAFNEESVIKEVVQNLSKYSYTIIIVDDGSAEDLNNILKGTKVYLLKHTLNLGQGAALQTGIEFALSKGADQIVTFDADGQHCVEDVQKLIDTLSKRNVDFVIGSRFLENSIHNMTADKKILLQAARYFNFIFTGLFLSDAHNGLRAFNSKAANRICLRENGMAHATEFLYWIRKMKLSFMEIPVTINYTEYSVKKGQKIWSSFRIFFDLLLGKLFK